MFLSKIIQNLEMVTAEHEAKCRIFASPGACTTAQMHTYEASLVHVKHLIL